jgi:putative Ca2+/H+ antiporter (TMEM165/GDT1 family)
MNLGVIAQVFAVIFIAEIPDKTALASLVLATRYRAAAVFFGACLALTLQTLIAVGAGQLFSLLPDKPVQIVSGLIFLVSAAFMLRRDDDDEEEGGEKKVGPGFGAQLWNTFVVVFIAEWGDLTQFGTAALAARYKAPLAVFTGATLALWCVVALAVLVGNRLSKVLKPEVMKKVAAVLFVIVGVVLIAGALHG